MFSHVMLGSSDLNKSKEFYDAILGVLGYEAGFMDEARERCFYRAKSGVFAFGTPIDGNPVSIANGGTIGFSASDSATVDLWYAAGIANGGTACEDPPGVREGGGHKAYCAYLRDPDGNKLSAVFR